MMLLKNELLHELKQEAKTTRAVLEAVNPEHADWAPHEKSMKLGGLAMHVAELFSWVTLALTTDELDFAKSYKPSPKLESKEQLLALFDETIAKALSTLEQAADDEFDKDWTFRAGDNVFFTQQKKNVIRTWSMNHLYHHRGQLTVYLRLQNISLPGVYGPTADSPKM